MVVEPIFHPIGPRGHGFISATKPVAVASFPVDMQLSGYLCFLEGNEALSQANGTVFVVIRDHHEERRGGFR